MKKSEWCLPDSGYLSHLTMDTWKEAVDLHYCEGGPRDGWQSFFLALVGEKVHQAGELRTENNKIGRDKVEWAVTLA